MVFTAVTNLADGVLKVVLPLMGAGLTASPMALSTLSVMLMLPTLLLSFHVGVLVDRHDRRSLLLLSNVVRISCLGVLLGYASIGGATLPVLYTLGFVLGVADVVAATAISALIPSVVPKSGWERTNAWVTGIETVAQEFCGPVVGGLLIATGTSVAVGTTGAAYVFAALTVLFLAGATKAKRHGGGGAEPVRRQIVEGLQFLWRQRTLRLTSAVLTVLCACWGAWLALMPLIAVHEMRLGSEEYGVLLSLLGVGGLAGAACVAWLNRLGNRRWVMFSDLVGTFAMVVAPLLSANIWVVGAAAFAGGFGGVLWSVNARTISQYLVPDGMRGRFSATARVFSLGAMPVGAGVAGVLGELIGPRAALALFAPPILLLVVPFLSTLTPKVLDGIFGDLTKTPPDEEAPAAEPATAEEKAV
ncbi:MFS transporter [Streptomyces sp. YC537]|uniref:MFS transporter n=1 Tax=Streptomyces boluensis TaxID=1775135 RepID=A0A964UKA5_9ACTN|nr:MFS transporter [Streptomyces boluensis]